MYVYILLEVCVYILLDVCAVCTNDARGESFL